MTGYLKMRWVRRAPSGRYRNRRRTTCIRLHHSGGSNPDPVPESIWDYHVCVRGWMAGGYHFFIRPDGEVVSMRHIDSVGSHSRPTNSLAVAICLGGNYYEIRPPKQQVRSAARLIRLIELRYGRLPVGGHKDDSPGHTECPGPYVVDMVKDALAKTPSPLYRA